jgi:hypothetical protein
MWWGLAPEAAGSVHYLRYAPGRRRLGGAPRDQPVPPITPAPPGTRKERKDHGKRADPSSLSPDASQGARTSRNLPDGASGARPGRSLGPSGGSLVDQAVADGLGGGEGAASAGVFTDVFRVTASGLGDPVEQ